jgi:hypothetical protein
MATTSRSCIFMTPAPSNAAPSWTFEPALYGAIVVLLAAPFFIFDTIPLYDLPNHIARQHILFGDGAAGADAYYRADWRFLPNLALEGATFALHRFVSVDGAIRVFLAATVVQLFLGAVALNRALSGAARPFALPAALFAFSGPLMFGFVNYCFGLGMALWVFAAWLRWRARMAFMPLLAFLASLILAAHLMAFAIYAIAVVACWASEAIPKALREGTPYALARSALELVHLAAPLALYAALAPHAAYLATPQYGAWIVRFLALSAAWGPEQPVFDLACYGLAAAGGLAVAPRLVLARPMLAPLAALAVAFLAAPHRLGEATFIDYRVPTAIFLFLTGALAWRDRADPWRRPATFFVAALFGARYAVMCVQWASWQPIYAEYRAAFALLPQGARLLPLSAAPETADLRDHPPLGHVAAFAVTQKGALIPNLFAGEGFQPLAYAPTYAALHTMRPSARDAAHYDYVLALHPERFAAGELPAFETIARGATFSLGRLLPPDAAP